MYKVLIFGDRNWGVPKFASVSEFAPANKLAQDQHKKIIEEIHALVKEHGRSNLLIIEGKARGADTIAGREAKIQGVHVAEVQALWDHYKRGAGPIRNQVMRYLEPDKGIGFHSDIENSKGSKNMRDQLLAADIPVRIVA